MGTTYINPGLAIDRNAALEGTTALGIRRALATLFVQSAPGVPVAGRLGADNFAVTGRADMGYNVTGGGAVLTRPTQGVYVVASHEPIVVTTDAASGVNPRIDRVYLHQYDPVIDGSSVDVRAHVAVAVGTPNAVPSLPLIPAGALELARYAIPAGATRTDVLTATDIAPVTGLATGGAVSKAGARTAAGISSGVGAPSNSFGDPGDIYFEILT